MKKKVNQKSKYVFFDCFPLEMIQLSRVIANRRKKNPKECAIFTRVCIAMLTIISPYIYLYRKLKTLLLGFLNRFTLKQELLLRNEKKWIKLSSESANMEWKFCDGMKADGGNEARHTMRVAKKSAKIYLKNVLRAVRAKIWQRRFHIFSIGERESILFQLNMVGRCFASTTTTTTEEKTERRKI